jgi:acetylornithine deacetylase/succinyl-diaminopimelate desuccinylase-like protein
MKKILLVVGLLLVVSAAALAQAPRETVHAYVTAHEHDILREYIELLSIPNVMADTANIRRNADAIVAMLQKRGVQARLLETGGSPLVYGELATPGATHTLAIYAHYDGQPVNAAQWHSQPWSPVLRDAPLDKGGKEVALNAAPTVIPGEWRLYVRSASDDKAPIEAVMVALDALRATGGKPSVNLKFLFEGEEEADSIHLGPAMKQYDNLIKAEAWLLCDGPVHQTRRMLVYLGARGLVGTEMTVYGATRPLHSGHYGNWAPNPAVMLAELLAGMRDDNANIRIAGWYDDVRPLTASEKQVVADMPAVDQQLEHDLGLARTEGKPEPLAMRIMRPGLNIRGLQSGNVGEKAQNAIPTEARASIDFRLVPDQTPEHVRKLFEDHIRAHGYYIIHQAPTAEERQNPKLVRLDWAAGYPAARTSMDLPISRAVVKTIETTLGAPVVRMPMLGGSVPMYLFLERAPVIGLPIVNHDNNQHAADENLRLQNLWDGIEVFAGLISDVGAEWK